MLTPVRQRHVDSKENPPACFHIINFTKHHIGIPNEKAQEETPQPYGSGEAAGGKAMPTPYLQLPSAGEHSSPACLASGIAARPGRGLVITPSESHEGEKPKTERQAAQLPDGSRHVVSLGKKKTRRPISVFSEVRSSPMK